VRQRALAALVAIEALGRALRCHLVLQVEYPTSVLWE
jgi:hypothetical protein